MRKTFTLIVIMFLMVGTLFAQTNRMSYQAVVRNVNNELVYNENVSVQVEILNASGVVQYAERHTTSTNANGMLSLTIGDGTHVEGTFANVVWQNAVIRSVFTLADGSTVTQSTPVTAVPYALYADSVDINKVYNAVADYFDHHSGSITETDPTVPEWAKAETKPTYDYSEIENTPTIPTVPTNVSAFDNDANYITAADIPTIPTVPADVSAFNNDAGYVSNALCDTVDICSLMAIINQLQVRISELEDKINSEDTTTTDPVQPTPTVIDGQPCPNAPTVVDYDGNVYNTVKIGEQCWMKENLRVKHYVGGTEIPEGTSVSYETAYRYCPNGDSTLVNMYGYLYNWKAVMHNSSSSNNNPSGIQGICPTGWHVPSVDEWEILFSPLYHQEEYTCGGGLNIAKALSDSTGWKNSTVECAIGNNVSMNNVTGFSAVPAGRYYGQYDMYQELGIYWTTAEYNTTMATNYNFVYSYGSVSPANYDKNIGMSVRCLKDDPNSANPENPTEGGTTTNGVPCPNTPTVTDVDGNVYNTIQIGDQCWMRENLRVTKRSDSTIIPSGNPNTSYTDPYYFDYSSHSLPLEKRGYLYNWPAAMVACPLGWHLPNNNEWTAFTDYVSAQSELICGSNSDFIAKALASTEGWYSFSGVCCPGDQSVDTNNALGFNAFPAGGYIGAFGFDKHFTRFWSSTENETNDAHNLNLGYDYGGVYRFTNDRNCGFSVRCIKDAPNSANPENPTGGGTTMNGVPCPNAPTVTDVDGNTYNTIQFGTQCWMAENLRTIPTNATYGVQGNTIRDAVDIGYYYYPNNSDELVSQYGLLYNWTAATGGTNDFQGTVQGVCPDGWHLPGYADYSQFRQYMDTVTYNNVANGYRCNISFSIAKSLAHASNWVESDIVCTPGNNVSTNNASGFDAPASGYVWYANYVDYNKRATFWTATEHNNDVTAGYYFGINHDKEDAYLSFDNKGNGRSVRCVRN